MGHQDRVPARRYLIIAGTTKAGTTSLHKYLRDHPQVCASTIKETRFFLDREYPLPSKYRSDDGLEHYGEFFAHRNGTSVWMEATPDYLYSPGTPARLAALPRVAVVFSLREPVARLLSWYRFARQMHQVAANQSFDVYVERQLEGPLPANPPQHLRALEQGRYAGYVRRFLEALGAERMLVTYLEDLAADPRRVIRAICRFAGLDEAMYDDYEFGIHNRTQPVRSSLVHRWHAGLRYHVGNYTHNRPFVKRPLRALMRVVEPWYLRANASREPPVRCSCATAERLAAYYADVAQELQLLVGASPPWLAPAAALARLTGDVVAGR